MQVYFLPLSAHRSAGGDRSSSILTTGRLIGEFVEGQGQWPRLVEAIEQCRRAGATLVIAKLGRLGRNPRFLSLAVESGVDFACLDNQQCNRFTVHILVATAEEESQKISERTKRTLAAAVKRKGIKLGSARPGHWEGREHLRGTKKAIAQSAKMRRQRTRADLRVHLPTLKEMRLAGKTMDEIAEWLNDNGHTTTAGHPFNQVVGVAVAETLPWRRFPGQGQGSRRQAADHPLHGEDGMTKLRAKRDKGQSSRRPSSTRRPTGFLPRRSVHAAERQGRARRSTTSITGTSRWRA